MAKHGIINEFSHFCRFWRVTPYNRRQQKRHAAGHGVMGG